MTKYRDWAGEFIDTSLEEWLKTPGEQIAGPEAKAHQERSDRQFSQDAHVRCHSSVNKTITVYNYGAVAVSLSENISGTNAGDSSVTGGTCSSTLRAAARIAPTR